jgi:hypothetical protein
LQPVAWFSAGFYFSIFTTHFTIMTNFIKGIGFIVFLFYCTAAQSQTYIASNAHSHNDYLNSKPFTRAYEAGFGSIEADIFPSNDTLYVAHSKKEIQAQRTLKSLYLDPLYHDLTINSSRRIKLLIDIKENYELSLKLFLCWCSTIRSAAVGVAPGFEAMASPTAQFKYFLWKRQWPIHELMDL